MSWLDCVVAKRTVCRKCLCRSAGVCGRPSAVQLRSPLLQPLLHNDLQMASNDLHREAKPLVRGGGQGRGRTADLPLFRRTLVPTELPAPDATSGRSASWLLWMLYAVPTGFEPATSALTGRRELQTSPRDHVLSCAVVPYPLGRTCGDLAVLPWRPGCPPLLRGEAYRTVGPWMSGRPPTLCTTSGRRSPGAVLRRLESGGREVATCPVCPVTCHGPACRAGSESGAGGYGSARSTERGAAVWGRSVV